MSEKEIGLIDEPNPSGGKDTLDILRHAQALTKFIKDTSTPMTIGIQGEWGSGKTSLLNAIVYELEGDKEDYFKKNYIPEEIEYEFKNFIEFFNMRKKKNKETIDLNFIRLKFRKGKQWVIY